MSCGRLVSSATTECSIAARRRNTLPRRILRPDAVS